MKIIPLFFLFLLVSCNSSDSIDCQELMFKSYKGHPRSNHKFKKHCQGKSLKYTKATCQAALTALMVNGSAEKLKSHYGEDILKCFTNDEKRKYLR